MKKIVSLLLAFSIVFSFVGCGHEHTWKEATCTEPKTCTGCGQTEGEPLGHTWKEATCTEPKTCTVCGQTEGEPLGHTWEEATCTEPKTCTVCGETEGAALGHSVGKWETVIEPTLSTWGLKQKTCSVCGAIIETETTHKKITYSGGSFNFTREEYIDFLEENVGTNVVIVDTFEEKVYGHNYYILFDNQVNAMISISENSRGSVSAIFVVGDDVSTIAIAIYLFSMMIGEDINDIDSNAILETMMNSSDVSYSKNGLKLKVLRASNDGVALTIVGA